jgi:hypothetical protein
MAIVVGGLVVAVSVFALPLVVVPADGSVTGLELANAAGFVGLLLLVLFSLAVAAVVTIGAWLFVSDGTEKARRSTAVTALVVLGMLGLTAVVGATSTHAGPPSAIGAGWSLMLCGLGVAGAGAVAILTTPTEGTEAVRVTRIGLGLAVSAPLAVALTIGAATAVVRDGSTWSGGFWLEHGPSAVARCVLNPSRDKFGTLIEYDAQNVVDGRADTAWRCPGSGIGESVEVDLGRWMPITRIGLLPGYAKTDPLYVRQWYGGGPAVRHQRVEPVGAVGACIDGADQACDHYNSWQRRGRPGGQGNALRPGCDL